MNLHTHDVCVWGERERERERVQLLESLDPQHWVSVFHGHLLKSPVLMLHDAQEVSSMEKVNYILKVVIQELDWKIQRFKSCLGYEASWAIHDLSASSTSKECPMWGPPILPMGPPTHQKNTWSANLTSGQDITANGFQEAQFGLLEGRVTKTTLLSWSYQLCAGP